MTRTLADITAESGRLVRELSGRGVTARLIGGLAVAEHRHREIPAPLRREYGDVDLVVHPQHARHFRTAMAELGYTPNVRFNNLRGDRRMLFTDSERDRKLDVFVGDFQMCHAMDLRQRLGLHSATLSPADLLLTKLQVVRINRKDLTDAVTILLTHDVREPDEGDHLSSARLAAVTGADWGWHTTFSDNLARIPGAAAELLEPEDARVVLDRTARIGETLANAPKSLKWRARSKLGRRVRWYELPEEIGGTIDARA